MICFYTSKCYYCFIIKSVQSVIIHENAIYTPARRPINLPLLQLSIKDEYNCMARLYCITNAYFFLLCKTKPQDLLQWILRRSAGNKFRSNAMGGTPIFAAGFSLGKERTIYSSLACKSFVIKPILLVWHPVDC